MSTVKTLIGPCRSSTSIILGALANSQDVDEAHYQPIKGAMRDGKVDSYRFYLGKPAKLLISKESIGHANRAESTLQVFDSEESIRKVDPVFIFREPISTYKSWKKMGWGNIDLFILSYMTIFDIYINAKKANAKVLLVLHEDFQENPRDILQRICRHWDISFNETMLNWEMLYSDHPKITMYGESSVLERNDLSHFRFLHSVRINPQKGANNHIKLEPEEEHRIQTELLPFYHDLIVDAEPKKHAPASG